MVDHCSCVFPTEIAGTITVIDIPSTLFIHSRNVCMGQINMKIAGQLSSPLDITEAVLSLHRTGDVFILAKGSSSLTKSEEETTNTESTTSHIYHYSILVDLQGSSNNNVICGYEIGLLLDRDTLRNTFILPEDIRRDRNDYSQIIYIGKYAMDMDQIAPVMAAKADPLHLAALSFKTLVKSNGSLCWTSKLNCRQFTRAMIQRLELKWPTILKIVGDDECFMIDCAMTLKCCVDYKIRILQDIQ